MADKQKLSPYTSKDKEPAKSLVLTEFRYLLLYPTRFVAMSRIVDGAISYDCNFSDKSDFKGPMLAFAHDPALGIIFAYYGAAVWEIIIKDETSKSFEEVALKFIEKKQDDGYFLVCVVNITPPILPLPR